MLALYSQVFPPPLVQWERWTGSTTSAANGSSEQGRPGDVVDPGRLLVWHRVLPTIGFSQRGGQRRPGIMPRSKSQKRQTGRSPRAWRPVNFHWTWPGSQDVSIRRRLGSCGSMSAPQRQYY